MGSSFWCVSVWVGEYNLFCFGSVCPNSMWMLGNISFFQLWIVFKDNIYFACVSGILLVLLMIIQRNVDVVSFPLD